MLLELPGETSKTLLKEFILCLQGRNSSKKRHANQPLMKIGTLVSPHQI